MASIFFKQNPALIPLFVACGGGMFAAAGYAGYTLAKSPEVVVSRIGPQQPWNNIKQHENPKLLTINKKFFEGRVGIEQPSSSYASSNDSVTE